jgi:peptidoglycan/xylan/chitin deacetylase (PgdA/CDA1 family)
MRLPGLKTMRHTANWLSSRFTDFVLILGYHRVAETTVDPYKLNVQPVHFAEQLDVLQRTTNVIDMKALHEGLSNGKLPRRAVIITFDDGYQDILHTVKPLLAARGLPATTFVVTGALGQQFWWDRLARLIFSPAILQESLSIQIGTETITWSARDLNQIAISKEVSSPRHRLLQQLYQRLTALPEERMSVLAQLQQWAGMAGAVAAEIDRSMTAAELQILAGDGLISVGSHTVTHPLLNVLPKEQQCLELSQSRQTLENILDQPVTTLSYPHGIYNTETERLVEESGYQMACCSQNGIVHRSQNRFALPRFWVPDWDGDHFARWLARWL